MKTTINWKSTLPYLFVIAGFVIISTAYFLPALEGKILHQHDIFEAKAMGVESKEYYEENEDRILWTNRMFGGMPTVFMAHSYKKNNNIFRNIILLIRMGLPHTHIAILFVTLLCFFITFQVLHKNIWLSTIGAIAFAFSSYNIIIIGAGHLNKSYAIAYMPLVISGVILSFKQKYYLSYILVLVGMGMLIFNNHIQITYYLGFAILTYLILEYYLAYSKKNIKNVIIASCILLGSVILSITPSISLLWTTLEYSKYSTRGGSELSDQFDNTQSRKGLDFDYAMAWSNGKMETFTILIPDFYGGSSSRGLSTNSHTFQELQKRGVAQPANIVKNLPTYWGDMPFTSGPVYFGAFVCFLFILSLFIVEKKLRWWAITTVVLMTMLSWGRHFSWLSELFFNYFPMYDKFRTVSMMLVIPSFIFPFVGMIGLKMIINKELEKKKILDALKKTSYIIGGILVFFFLFGPSLFSFSSPGDQRLMSGGYPEWLIAALREDRASLLIMDSLRSLIFAGLGAVVLWLHITEKMKNVKWLYAFVGLIILVDLWGVNKRYVNDDNFSHPRESQQQQPKHPANEFILQDSEPYFRVFTLQNPFNDTQTTAWHFSVGGYHAAKINSYQELIDFYLEPERRKIVQTLSSQENQVPIHQTLAQCNALNMLNTKYIISNPEGRPIENPFRLGNVWFVDSILIVGSADEEITSIGTVNLGNTAIVHQQFSETLSDYSLVKDVSASIQLTHYHPDKLSYQSNTNTPMLAVFSEIYYTAGWKAYINGVEAPYIRANHVLRAMVVPPGENSIEFRFEPKSYYQGLIISLIASIITLLVLITLVFLHINKIVKRKHNHDSME